jgi:hypothetical protein
MGTDWYSSPVRETDFDSFLVRPGAEQTGLKRPPQRRSATWQKPGARGQVSGPFESFLKAEEAEDPRDSLDFDSFLKTALPGSTAAPSRQQQQAPATAAVPAVPLPGQVRVLVMFGTEYSFSKEIAEMLCTKLVAAEKYW